MKIRNLAYSVIAIVALVVGLSYQNPATLQAQSTLLYDGFDSPPLNTSLWDSSSSNWTAHVEVSGGSLIVYSGTVDGGGGTVLSNQTFTLSAQTLVFETRAKTSSADGGSVGVWSDNADGFALFVVDRNGNFITGVRPNKTATPVNQTITGVDVTAWHTYRIEMNESFAKFYVDSNLAATFTTDLPLNKPMHVRLDRVSRGAEQTLTVDWVRVETGSPPPGNETTTLKPVMKNFNTGSETCTSTYTIDNDGSYVIAYNHAFYNAEVGGSVIHTFQDTIPPFSSRTYNLANIPIPNGYRGRVEIQADRPSNMIVDPCPGSSDTTPPSITNIQKSSPYVNKQSCANPNTVTIRADVTDPSGLASVQLYYQPPGQGWAQTSMSLEAGDTYKATIGPFSQSGTMPFFIRAQDNFGNPKEANMEYLSIACVTISHMEVIQVTQNITNTVPLIAGKPTLVRVYVDCGAGCTSLPGVTGGLEVSGPAGGISLDPSPQTITAEHPQDGWTSQRGRSDKTLNFIVPTELITGTVNFTVIVNSASDSVSLPFQPARTLRIAYVPIHYDPSSCNWTGDREPDNTRIAKAYRWAQKVYPTAKIEYIPWSKIIWDKPLREGQDCLGNNIDSAMIKLNDQLTLQWRAATNPPDYLFGWLPDNAVEGGMADVGWILWLEYGYKLVAHGEDDKTYSEQIFTHEIAHLLGRHHTKATNDPYNCANLDTGPLNDWHYEDGYIQEYGAEIGDIHSQNSFSLLHPFSTYDYMSYCWFESGLPVWTSPHTYEKIYSQKLRDLSTTAQVQILATPQPHFIISGFIYADNTATLDPIWIITTSTPSESPSNGTEYCLELQNASGMPLNSQCFDLAFFNYENGEATNVDGFNLLFPYSSSVTRVVLKKGTQELAVRSVSANSPQVTVTSPNGGEIWSKDGTHTIRWIGNDLDGDPLTYNVLYSPDGAFWLPISSQTTENQITVIASQLVGGNGAKIRVLATDGINTASDDSDNSFTVERKGPRVYILSPEENTTISSGTAMYLQGSAYDLEDGTLDENMLRWTSNLDGDLGTGSLILTTLSQGQHTITLTAMDSDNNAATATITVAVGFTKTYLPIILK